MAEGKNKKHALDYIIYTDGGYSMNQDKGASAYVVLTPDESEVVLQDAFTIEHETSPRAELHAIIAGCEMVPNGATVKVITDSKYAILVLGRKKDVEGQKNPDLISRFRKIKKDKSLYVEFEWVKGHSGNRWNELCDHLCDEAAGIDLNDYPKKKSKPKTPKAPKKPKKEFVPPSVEEIRAFCDKEDLFVNPEFFHNYYEAKNWHKGQYPMQNWQKTCREWDTRAEQWFADTRHISIGP